MTERQARFVEAFLGPAKLNATAAARLANFRWPNKQGPALLRHPAVKPAIDAGFATLCAAVTPTPRDWKDDLATWGEARRAAWRRRVSELEDLGVPWKEAEREAYLDLLALT